MTTPLKSDALLAVEGLGIHVGGKRLLRDIGFSLRPGEALTLVGESGAGKSLLAQAIMGNLPASLSCSGTVDVGGCRSDAADLPARRALWGRQLALLPQDWAVDYATALGDDMYSDQMRAFIDTLGGQWFTGKLANKAISAISNPTSTCKLKANILSHLLS